MFSYLSDSYKYLLDEAGRVSMADRTENLSIVLGVISWAIVKVTLVIPSATLSSEITKADLMLCYRLILKLN